MLAFGAFMLIFCKVSVAKVPNGVVFKSGLVACIAIFGIAWMSNTYFQHAMPEFKVAITDMVNTSMDFWFRALCCICGCKLTGATAKILIPVALALGLPASVLIGLMPAYQCLFLYSKLPIRYCNSKL